MFKDAPLRLPNLCSPSPDLICGGMPSPDDLRNAQKAGVRTVVNLCQPQETPPYEASLVQELGMQYVQIPVGGPPDLTETKARELAAVVDNCANHPVLIHCMSGNRVGALLALKASYADGASAQEALQFGRASGLKALEPAVWQIVSSRKATAG